MKEHTQQELVVLSLAEHREWRRAYELENRLVGNEKIGSEADTRLYEVFDKNVGDAAEKETTRTIDGREYTIQTRKQGSERTWRAFLSKEKPRQIVRFIERDGERIAQISYV